MEMLIPLTFIYLGSFDILPVVASYMDFRTNSTLAPKRYRKSYGIN
jgi:hypothetical protein